MAAVNYALTILCSCFLSFARGFGQDCDIWLKLCRHTVVHYCKSHLRPASNRLSCDSHPFEQYTTLSHISAVTTRTYRMYKFLTAYSTTKIRLKIPINRGRGKTFLNSHLHNLNTIQV